MQRADAVDSPRRLHLTLFMTTCAFGEYVGYMEVV